MIYPSYLSRYYNFIVLTPNVETSWDTEVKYAITWSTTDGISDVKLALYKDGEFLMEIWVEDTPNDKRSVAYLIPNQNQKLSSIELRDFLKQKLPEFMIPSHFVELDAFPFTPNQKIDRAALRIALRLLTLVCSLLPCFLGLPRFSGIPISTTLASHSLTQMITIPIFTKST